MPAARWFRISSGLGVPNQRQRRLWTAELVPWNPNRAQWWIIWLVAVVCVLGWPPGNGGTSLGTKAVRWLADPSGTLPVMPEPLPLGLGDDGYAVAEHDAQQAEYFAARDIALQGGDSSANEAQPFGEEDGYAVPCHTQNQNRRGIWNIENLDLKPLAEARVYEFAFVWAPLRLYGATGSPGNPIAIY